MGRSTRAVAAALVVLGLAVSGCSGTRSVSSGAGGAAAGPSGPATAAAPASVDPTPSNAGAPITVVGDPTTSTTSSPAESSSPVTSTSATPTPTTPAPKPAAVVASPAFGSTTVGPLQPLTVRATSGRITALVVRAEDGSAISGTLSADRTSWTSHQRLRYGGSYTATGTAAGEPGSRPTAISGTWTVFSVPDTVSTAISPGDGQTVGVAAPIIIRFGYGSTAEQKREIMKHVTITTTPKVQGGFGWFVHDGDQIASLDWRPKDFWPEGTKVTVTVDLLGVPFADGLYGGRYPVTSSFTIGRNRVTYADPASHQLTVKEDGKVVAQYPMSMGRGDDVGDPNLVTRSGIHIVLDKEADTKMSNPAYGYKDLPEKWAVRISNNGEFIHQNLASVWAQGKENVSHGCINLNDVNAEAYFDKAMYGDPVVITGTSVKLGPADGDYYGWALPWDQFVGHGLS